MEQPNYSSTSLNRNDMPTSRPAQQSSNDSNRVSRGPPTKPTEPSASAAVPKRVCFETQVDSSFGDSFAEPTLPTPYAHKRKGEPNQADGTKKSRADNSFMEPSFFKNDGSNAKINQSPDVKSDSSFNGSFSVVWKTSYSLNKKST